MNQNNKTIIARATIAALTLAGALSSCVYQDTRDDLTDSKAAAAKYRIQIIEGATSSIVHQSTYYTNSYVRAEHSVTFTDARDGKEVSLIGGVIKVYEQ